MMFVFFTTDKGNTFPAIITGSGSGSFRSLTVFPEMRHLMFRVAQRGAPGERGTWNPLPPSGWKGGDTH